LEFISLEKQFMLRGPALAALAATLLPCGLGWAQQDGCRERTVPVTILNPDGSSPQGLGTTTFEASYKGKPVVIKSVTIDQRQRRILLLMDASGSLLGEDSVDARLAMDVADDLVDNIPGPSEIGFASFSMKIEQSLAPTVDRAKVKNEIANLRSSRAAMQKQGNRLTALWDAILENSKLLNSHQIGDVIFVITDGETDAGKTKASEVARTLLAAGTRLYTVEIRRGDILGGQAIMQLQGGLNEFDQVLSETGGIAVIPPPRSPFFTRELTSMDKSGKASWMRVALNSQYRQMLFFYRIEVELPESVRKAESWHLHVMSPEKPMKKDLVLIYPEKLAPCD
jgi:von Willebrand factor type A domain